MKKFLVFLFIHMIFFIIPTITYAKNLDIGEVAKLIDFNAQCKDVLSEGKEWLLVCKVDYSKSIIFTNCSII